MNGRALKRTLTTLALVLTLAPTAMVAQPLDLAEAMRLGLDEAIPGLGNPQPASVSVVTGRLDSFRFKSAEDTVFTTRDTFRTVPNLATIVHLDAGSAMLVTFCAECTSVGPGSTTAFPVRATVDGVELTPGGLHNRFLFSTTPDDNLYNSRCVQWAAPSIGAGGRTVRIEWRSTGELQASWCRDRSMLVQWNR